MLQITKPKKEKVKELINADIKNFGKRNHDIYVKKITYTTEIKDDGTIIKRPTEELTNLTNKINATAQLIKQQNAEDILEQIKKSLS